MQRKQPISSEMTEITVGHSCTDVSKKNKIINNLAFICGLYWMLSEGVSEYAVVSGLVILEQSGQGHSFSGLLASPCVPVWYRRLTCAVNY